MIIYLRFSFSAHIQFHPYFPKHSTASLNQKQKQEKTLQISAFSFQILCFRISGLSSPQRENILHKAGPGNKSDLGANQTHNGIMPQKKNEGLPHRRSPQSIQLGWWEGSKKNTNMLAGMSKKGNPCTLLVQIQIDAATVENFMEIS